MRADMHVVGRVDCDALWSIVFAISQPCHHSKLWPPSLIALVYVSAVLFRNCGSVCFESAKTTVVL
jgi:hypothetical protein